MKGLDKEKWEEAAKELNSYLEYADLQKTTVGIRNLLLTYLVAGKCGVDIWFPDFMEELQLLFDLLDSLAAIYPEDGTANRIGR